MIKRKKIISIIISISLISMFMVGCSNNRNELSINYDYSSPDDLNIKNASEMDISEEYLSGFQFIGTDNPESVSKYDKLELVSYKMIGFDRETSSYKINALIKNNSDKSISNIKGSLGVMGKHGGFSEENINIESIAAGETKSHEILISQESLAYAVSEIEDENEEIDYQSIINEAIKNKSITGELEYTYDNDYSKYMHIRKTLNFDGSTIGTNLIFEKETSKKEFDNSDSYHVDNGSYLNIVHNKNTAYFDNILMNNIELKLNEDFNFEVTAKFKNISDKEIKSFYFEPYIDLLGYSLYPLEEYELRELNTYKNKVIKPNEEFEIKTVLSSTTFLEADLGIMDELRCLKELNMESDEPILVQLIENRLFSLGVDYNYEIKNNNGNTVSKDIRSVYMGNGKISTLNASEYTYDSDEEDSSEIPDLYFNDNGDLVDENGDIPQLDKDTLNKIVEEYYSLLN